MIDVKWIVESYTLPRSCDSAPFASVKLLEEKRLDERFIELGNDESLS